MRIGGSLPKGMNSSQLSSSAVHPNHFYQTQSLPRDGYNHNQNTNYHSLDYASDTNSVPRIFNESCTFGSSSQQNQSNNQIVKRNNYLSVVNQSDD